MSVLKGNIAPKGTMTGSISAVYGKDGISVTHEWDGTTLKVTSASGTSSADLKGAKGDRGEKGETGNSGVYLGSGEMPDDCNVQIDPNGEPLDAEQFASKAYVDNAVKGKTYERIETITLTEDTGTIERTQEPDGTPYNFEAVMLVCNMAAGEKASYLSHGVRMSNNNTCDYYMDKGINTTVAKIVIHTYSLYGKVMGMFSRPVTNNWDVPNGWYPIIYEHLKKDFAPINRVMVSGGASLPIGSVIEVWGVRADA